MMTKRLATLALGLAGTLLATAPVLAADHEVKMLNRGSDGEIMVFEPAFLKVAPGDTVTFVAADKAHNTESVLGMIPDGAEAWKGKINEEVTVTLDVEGIYGVKCTPHYGLGMVGLIQVGENVANLDEAKSVKHPGRAGQRMTALFEQVQGDSTQAGAQ
jgi:pseudoazurin